MNAMLDRLGTTNGGFVVAALYKFVLLDDIDGLRQAYVDEGPSDGEVVLLLHGEGIQSKDQHERPIVDDDFLVLFHAGAEPLRFTEARIDWGTGQVETITFDQPTGAEVLNLAHDFGSVDAAGARGDVRVTLMPVRGEAAPVRLRIRAGEDRS